MINWAHVHLLLNHVPVIGTYAAILLLAFAIVRRSTELARVALGAFVLLAVSAVVVFLTGTAAEKVVEEIPGVSERAIEHHEESALAATIALGLLGLGSLWVLIRSSKTGSPSPRAVTALLVLSLIPAGLLAWTANLGGQIRHTEIVRHTEAPPP